MAKPLPKHILTEPPRWNVPQGDDGEKDRQRFEEWTNARLDEMHAQEDKIEFDEETYDPTRDPFYIPDPKYVGAVEKDVTERLKRGRVKLAARAGDHETLARLATTEELRRLAYKPYKRGREKGEPRPRDLPDRLKSSLEEASYDVERIREIWQQHYGRRNRKAEPTAIEIAARRHGIKDHKLINFRKNLHRRSGPIFLRLKSPI